MSTLVTNLGLKILNNPFLLLRCAVANLGKGFSQEQRGGFLDIAFCSNSPDNLIKSDFCQSFVTMKLVG